MKTYLLYHQARYSVKVSRDGFLQGIRRMNVGMTRAHRKLLLVGDSSTLCRHPFFWGVFGSCEGGGGLPHSA
jgi:superfamily I DNA and/or RNA helicase